MSCCITAHRVYNKYIDKFIPFQIMSTLHHEDLLWDIFDEVCENFPYLDEEKQIEIANKRFEELCQ